MSDHYHFMKSAINKMNEKEIRIELSLIIGEEKKFVYGLNRDDYIFLMFDRWKSLGMNNCRYVNRW